MRSKVRVLMLLGALLLVGFTAFSAAQAAAPAGPDAALLASVEAQLPDPEARGPYEVGRKYVLVPRPNNPAYEAYLYYPSTTEGFDTPLDPSGGPYPGIVLGHGFLSSPLNYEGNSRHLASWGYYVLAIGSYTGFFPDIPAYVADFSHGLTFLTDQNANPNSPLFGTVDTEAYGATGHSMGGGASIWATWRDPRIKALINLAAAETSPSAIDIMSEVNVPVALLAASEDIITPIGSNQQPMYDNGNAPKLIPILLGADHCAFASEAVGCGLGQMTDERQVEITNRWLAAFFNLYLRGETLNAWYVWGPGMVFDPELDTQWDAGFTVGPDAQNGSGAPGESIVYQMTVTNTGPDAASYSLAAYLNDWNATVSPANTGELAPGASADITITIAVPADAVGSDTLLLAATADSDGATAQFGIIETTVP